MLEWKYLGHADNKKLSENTNFAVLATYKVGYKNPSEMVRNIVLAYGLEAKFCHSGLALNNQLQCSIGAFVPGDAGHTHGLASAAASGIYVARCIEL